MLLGPVEGQFNPPPRGNERKSFNPGKVFCCHNKQMRTCLHCRTGHCYYCRQKCLDLYYYGTVFTVLTLYDYGLRLRTAVQKIIITVGQSHRLQYYGKVAE